MTIEMSGLKENLIYCLLKAAMTLLGIAVLVSLAGVDLLDFQSVVLHQQLVTLGELLLLR